MEWFNWAMAACAAGDRWGDLHGLFEELQSAKMADAESYRQGFQRAPTTSLLIDGGWWLFVVNDSEWC